MDLWSDEDTDFFDNIVGYMENISTHSLIR